MDKLNILSTKIKLLDENKYVILDKYIMHIPLTEESYKKEGKRLLGKENPCILERKLIERDIAIKIIEKLKYEKLYIKNEVLWLFELYGFNGSYVMLYRDN